MATNNTINAPLPLVVAQGGTGLATLTAHGVLLGEGTANVTPITLAAGQVLIGTTASDPAAAAITGSGNVTVTSSSGAIAISLTGTASFAWNDVTGTSQTMAVNNGYIADNAGLVTITLPTTAALGTTQSVAGNGAGGWTIAQNASQNIKFGNQTTTTGAGGSLSSTNRYDQIALLCTVANTTWVVLNAVGNITFV